MTQTLKDNKVYIDGEFVANLPPGACVVTVGGITWINGKLVHTAEDQEEEEEKPARAWYESDSIALPMAMAAPVAAFCYGLFRLVEYLVLNAGSMFFIN